MGGLFAASRTIDAYKNDHGEEKTEDKHMDLPADLANGIIIALLKNVRPDAVPPSLSTWRAP